MTVVVVVVCGVLGLDEQAATTLPLTAWRNRQHHTGAPACHAPTAAARLPEVNTVTNLQQQQQQQKQWPSLS